MKHYKDNLKCDKCEICSNTHNRLEVHHIDGNHYTNNEPENLMTLCPSCHKKEHYKMGRTKAGQKGKLTELFKIDSIISNGIEKVYDVEMDKPFHTFTLKNGIVTSNSHAAAYTIMSLYGQWFKIYFPLQFWSATFSFGNEKTYPRFLSEIYKIGGIKVRAVDINLSGEAVNSDLSTNALYWSLNSVKQCGDKAFTQLVSERETNGEYLNFDNFLTRHVRKGSKVNKAVIENLIICGAFDNIEFIGDNILERWRLVQYYHEYAKIRGDHSSKFENPDSKIWWSLKQRELCGLSMINYGDIESTISRTSQWDTPDLFQSYGNGASVKVSGYVQELEIKNIRGGKRMAIIKLDHNYENFSITLWSETLDQYETEIKNSIGKIMSFKGEIKFDNYWGEFKVFL